MDEPLVVLVETIESCNRRCAFCKWGSLREPVASRLMSQSTLDSIADQLSAINYQGRISPFGINEPLLDSRIVEIVELFYGACPGAFLSLNTNGDYLSQAKAQSLFDAGLNAIGISVYDDAAQAKALTYQDPRITRIDMREPSNLENRGGSIAVAGARPEIGKGCSRPSHMLTIKATGEIVLCCSDMYGNVVMGNVADGIMDVWNGPGFEHYRDQLARSNRLGLKLCEGCSYEGQMPWREYPLPGGSCG